jgi:hypothetical protein
MDLVEISGAVAQHHNAVSLLRERIDYLFVAVMKGDPRFTKPEHATPGFDSVAYDGDWAAKGKRVPSSEEVFGA